MSLSHHSQGNEQCPKPAQLRESSKTALYPATQTPNLTDVMERGASSRRSPMAPPPLSPCLQELGVQRRVHRSHHIVHSGQEAKRFQNFTFLLSLSPSCLPPSPSALLIFVPPPLVTPSLTALAFSDRHKQKDWWFR